jgi:type IV secretory pathway VirB10-like protein
MNITRAIILAACAVLVIPSTYAGAQNPPAASLTADQLARVQALQQQLQGLNQNFQSATGKPLFPNASSAPLTPTQPNTTDVQSDYANALAELGGTPVAPAPKPAAAAPPAASGTTSPTAVPPPGPRSKIPVGYLAQGRLDMTVNSDYPGPWRGILDHPIMSIDGSKILFPVGSKIVGRVVSIGGINAAINNRLGLLPRYIVLPNGDAFKISDQAILDELGISGIADQVDYHLGVQLAAIGAFTLVQAAPTVISAQAGATTANTSTTQTPQGSFASQASNAGEEIINRYTSLLPTIEVRAGTPFRIFFNEEMLAPVTRPTDAFQLTNVGDKPRAVQ